MSSPHPRGERKPSAGPRACVRAWCVRDVRDVRGVRGVRACGRAAQRRSPRRFLQLSRQGPPSCVAPGQRPGTPAGCKRPKETHGWDLLPFSLAGQGAQWTARAQAGRGSRPGGRSRAGWWSRCCRQGDLAAEVRCLSGPPGVVEGPGAGGWIWGPAGSVPASPRPQLRRRLRGGGGGTSRSRQGLSGATPPLAGR